MIKTYVLLINVFAICITDSFAGNPNCDTSNVFGDQWITCIESNCPSDSIKTIYENNNLRRIFKYYNCKDSGEFIYFSESGDTLSHSFFLDGNTIGIAKYWYSKGVQKRITNYDSSGEKHGWEVFWYDNGNVKDSIFFQNDSTFKRKTFYYNGKIAIREKDIYSSYDAVSYDPKGKKTGFIENGNGEIFVCDSVGKNCKSLKFKNGKQVFK